MSETVAMITSARSHVGVGQCNAAILAALLEAGYRAVCAQSQEDTPLQRRLLALGAEYHWLDYDPDADPRRFAGDVDAMQKLIKRIGPDLVYISNSHPQYGYAGIEAALSLSIPTVIREDVVAAHLLPKLEPRLSDMRSHYQNAAAVIAVSNQNLDLLRRHFRLAGDIGQVIPSNAADAFFEPVDRARRRRLRAGWGIAEGAIVCFTTAKLEAIKGYRIQLAAIEKLMQMPVWARLHFVWAGAGKMGAEISERLGQMAATDHVTLTGHVWNVAELLDAADIFLLPSLAEGMPRAIVEAMAKGVPVIATDAGGNGEALAGCGQILKPFKDMESAAADLAAAIAAWAADGAARKAAGIAGRTRARTHHKEGMVMDQHIAVVRNILNAAGN